MSSQAVTVRYDKVSFSYTFAKPTLDEVSFSVRKGMKIALMGQNGAGKSTLFKLLTGAIQPTAGVISVDVKLTVATAFQVIPPDQMELSVLEYFKKYCPTDEHDLKRKIAGVLDA